MVTKRNKLQVDEKYIQETKTPNSSFENMEGKPFPSEDVYPIVTPINIYWRGLDVIKEHWDKSSEYYNYGPDTKEYEEYIFWRKNLIIWTCCTIESFVNMEGVSWMGEEFYKSNIERQNIIQKIRLIYAIKYNKRLSRSNDTLKNIKKLFDIRNQFVHPKTKSADDYSDSGQNWEIYNPNNLEKIVKAVNGLIIRDPS